MIFRLEYKNKALKTARVDIITPTGTGVETVEGTGYPFMLKYEGDKKNKGLMFLSSSAEINIYETPLFNIDTLKTSGEKDIRVNYYIDSVLEWTGFVIPDFFSREIGGDGVVSMVASDRLSVLDSEVLEGLPVTVTLRTLLSLSLAKTGLTLPLKTVVDFAISGTTQRVLDYKIRSQRLTDTKGRSVNCKDIIKSILVATNSKLMQRKGAWWVVNKMQHELGGGRVYTSPTAFTNYVEGLISFTDVTRGAMRTIAPVAGGVGVFQEYGGGALAPNNYAFESGLSGWTLHNGFTASTNNRRVLGYTQSGKVYTPIYDSPGTAKPYLVNRNLRPADNHIHLTNIYTIPHARASIPVVSANPFSAKIKVEVNATGRGGGSAAAFVVMLKRPGRDSLILNRDGQWLTGMGYKALLFATFPGEELEAADGNGSYDGTIDAAGDAGFEDDINNYSIDLLILGAGRSLSDGTTVVRDETALINSASVQFSAASNDTPKGTLYKADQGGESYTKIHDTETTVFGDYLTGGLNGYFYNYAPDDTSSLLAPNGSRSQPAWVNTYTQNTEPLPLLQQTIRQMRRMFSVAHDFIKGEIDVADFDPLSIFEDCERRFVIVEAEFDFLRGSLQVVLEEVAYQNLTVREYIYSYFGEGDEGIRGISGISAGSSGGGGGGGMAPEPSWLENEITIDPESGLLSVDGWHVKGDLIIEGQVNQWLAQQLVVDDARIQVNRRQGGATVDSGLVIFNKDSGSEVSSLVYDVDGIWRAGGQRIFTDDYNPKLGGYSAASYPRKAEAAVITGAWTFNGNTTFNNEGNSGLLRGTDSQRMLIGGGSNWSSANGAYVVIEGSDFGGTGLGGNVSFALPLGKEVRINRNLFIGNTGTATERLHVAGNGLFEGNAFFKNQYIKFGIETAGYDLVVTSDYNSDFKYLTIDGNNYWSAFQTSLSVGKNTIPAATLDVNGSLRVSGTSTLTGAVTAGGNVGTSNFASQSQGWRVTPAGIADFRHIYTDELQAKAFTADISQALVGSDVLTKSVAKLAQNWATTADGATSNLYVEELEGFPDYQVFAVGDRLLLRLFDRSGGGLLIKNIWATVTSYVSTTDNVQRYTITVNSGGATGQTVYAGSMILDYGTSGSGVIERTVLDAMGSPYSQVKTWVNDPSNPANYTIHNRTGNLDGIANASGFGFYGENTFLTGKLLVGDLTKQGQYMEYENGQLNIKGQITVTGGNAATKADVDAVQVGGRNLVRKGQIRGYNSAVVQESGTFDGIPKFVNTSSSSGNFGFQYISTIPAERPADTWLTLSFKVFVRTFDSPSNMAGYVRVNNEDGTTSEYPYLSVIPDFRLSENQNRWIEIVHTFLLTKPITSINRFYFWRSGVLAGDLDFTSPKLETGNRATDWTPAPEDVDAGIAAAQSAADTANALISDIASDSKLTASEKKAVRKEWDIIDAEYGKIMQQIVNFGIPSSNYGAVYYQLGTYLNNGINWTTGVPAWISDANLGITTSIDGALFRSHFKAYYDQRTEVLNAVAAKNKESVDALDYLAEAIEGDTTIEGGLVGTNVLQLKDSGGAVRGGMSGLTSDNIGFWAGGTYQDAINDNANVILRKDGSAMFAAGRINILSDGDTTIGDIHVDAGGALVVKDGTYNRVLITKKDVTTLADIAGSSQNTTVNNSTDSYYASVGYFTVSQPNTITVNNNGTQLTVTGAFGLSMTTGAGQKDSQSELYVAVYLRKIGDGRGTGIFLSSGLVTVNKLAGESMDDYFYGRSLNKVAIVSAGQYRIVADYTRRVNGSGPHEDDDYLATIHINETSMHALYNGSYQRNEIGKNGIGVISSSFNYSFFGQEGSVYKSVEKVSNATMYDKPGVLFAGNIAADGSLTAGYWGAKYREGSYREADYVYRIHHDVGHKNYYVLLTPRLNAFVWVVSKEANYVRVRSTLAGISFDFAIIGNNQ